MRIALYARVSTTKKKEGTYENPSKPGEIEYEQNPETQLILLRDWVKARGFEVVDDLTFVDRASGAKSNRPALQKLMEMAHNRAFDGVACTKIDRFGRSAINLQNMVLELKNLGITFTAITQPIDTSSPLGEFLFQIMTAYAQLERSMIRERVMEGIHRARVEGIRLGRPPAGTGKKYGPNATPITINDIIDLEENIKDDPDTKPIWETLGISRATFYRIKGQAKEAQESVSEANLNESP